LLWVCILDQPKVLSSGNSSLQHCFVPGKRIARK
jgi:hypothetical protein